MPLNYFSRRSISAKSFRSSAPWTFVEPCQSLHQAETESAFISFLKFVAGSVFKTTFRWVIRLSEWRGGVSKFNRSSISVHRITIVESSACASLGPSVAQILGWKYFDNRVENGALNPGAGPGPGPRAGAGAGAGWVVSCAQPTLPDHGPRGLTVVVADVCDLSIVNDAGLPREFLPEPLGSAVLPSSENLRKVMRALRPVNALGARPSRSILGGRPSSRLTGLNRGFRRSHQPSHQPEDADDCDANSKIRAVMPAVGPAMNEDDRASTNAN